MRWQYWIVNYIGKKELKQVLAKYITGRLIDIGCGEKPFESLLQA